MYKGADRDTRLIKRAKQEGTASFYNSMAPAGGAPPVAAFEKDYEGIKVQMWRGLSDGVAQRVVSEAAAWASLASSPK